MTSGERTYRAGSMISQKGLKYPQSLAVTPCRRPSAILSWEDMELNVIDFDEKLDGIREEATEIDPKGAKDIV